MYEVPIIWRFEGDRNRGAAYMRQGAALMAMLERSMSFMGLEQCVLRRHVTPDVRIKCACIFGIRTVTITVSPGIGEPRKVLLECFANTTVALAYVLDVALLKEEEEGQSQSDDEPPEYDPWEGEEPSEENWPRGLYCTRRLRYTVAVCDGRGEYVLFRLTKAASTDHTPRLPGDQVLVLQHRTSDLPKGVLAAATAAPMNKLSPFTRKLCNFVDECVSIIPYPVSMMRVYEVEER